MVHRLELLAHRSTPTISCKPMKPMHDMEGDGGKMSPDIDITYKGVLPYCGATFGLTDMQAIANRLSRTMEDPGDHPPRERVNQPKGKILGWMVTSLHQTKLAKGCSKKGTPCRIGIFRCPADVR